MVDRAYQTLDTLMTDPQASPSVRLKAAIYIIEKATTAPLPQKQPVPLDIEKLRISHAPPVTPQIMHNLHNEAQSKPPQPLPQPQTIRRETPKIGRNETCPCGVPSGPGQKHKRCCLNKPQPAAA